MNNLSFTLTKITENNSHYDRLEIKKIIVLYEEPALYIGDSIIRINYLAGLKTFFPKAKLYLNFVNKDFASCYLALTKNNPNIDELCQFQWEEISFESFDMIICLMHEELKFLTHIHRRFANLISNETIKLKVFSVSKEVMSNGSKITISDGKHKGFIFPKFNEFIEFFEKQVDQNIREVYIMEEEREWGANWLAKNGLMSDESLFIIVDSTSKKYKMMAIQTYIKFLKYILSLPKSRVLIFDEKNLGKQEFYKQLLGDELFSRMIFAKGNTLRQDLSIISADAVKLVFGPCTGLLHCASGIYNHLLKKGMPLATIPFIITYTGKYYHGNGNANNWWYNSPLVDCLLLRSTKDGTEMAVLEELSPEEREMEDNQLECSLYTAEMFINFINDRLKTGRTLTNA